MNLCVGCVGKKSCVEERGLVCKGLKRGLGKVMQTIDV